MKNKLEKTIAQNIRNYRKQAHLSQADLAEKINRTPEMVCKIENNKVGITCYMINCIADAFNIDAHLLTIPNSAIMNNLSPEMISLIQLEQKLSSRKIEALTLLLKE